MIKSTKPVFFGTPDENIVNLVCTLNEFPGIVTRASCGGHENPEKTQQPKGKWFVTFEVVPSVSPWGFARSEPDPTGLNYIMCAAVLYPGVKLEVITSESGVNCALCGDGIDPDEIATELQQQLGTLHYLLQQETKAWARSKGETAITD